MESTRSSSTSMSNEVSEGLRARARRVRAGRLCRLTCRASVSHEACKFGESVCRVPQNSLMHHPQWVDVKGREAAATESRVNCNYCETDDHETSSCPKVQVGMALTFRVVGCSKPMHSSFTIPA